jgi:hypothetical protein
MFAVLFVGICIVGFVSGRQVNKALVNMNIIAG